MILSGLVEIGLQTLPQGFQFGLNDLIQLGGIHAQLLSRGLYMAIHAINRLYSTMS